MKSVELLLQPDERSLLEELALGGARVSDDADVDVSPQRCSLHGRLGNASEQHKQDAALHLVVTLRDE